MQILHIASYLLILIFNTILHKTDNSNYLCICSNEPIRTFDLFYDAWQAVVACSNGTKYISANSIL